MINLDSPKTYRRLDPSGLGRRIRELPAQVEVAWRQSRAAQLPGGWRDLRQVVVAGMGGSAIAGDLVRDLSSDQQGAPVTVLRGFQLPFPLTASHLLVACSHSGNTEETLSLFRQARRSPARVLVLASGGELAALTEAEGVPLLRLPPAGEPRSALGHNLMLLLGVLDRLGLVTTPEAEVQSAVAALREQSPLLAEGVPLERNPAKQVAAWLEGRLALIYGGGIFSGAARRWKSQLNENSKAWAFQEELPELLHNSVEAFQAPEPSSASALLLRPRHISVELARRYDITERLLEQQNIPFRRVEGCEGSPLAQILGMVHLGDYASYYLAIGRGLDPAATPLLDQGKRLAARESLLQSS